MKKIIIIASLVALTSTSVFAQQQSVTDATVEDFYRMEQRAIPSTSTQCQQVNVPMNNGNFNNGNRASTGDTVFGALIGGALGNQVGGGSGKDAMTVLGAIIGADVANKRANNRSQQGGYGYTVQQQCREITTYSYTSEQVYDYSIITFWTDRQHRIRFQK